MSLRLRRDSGFTLIELMMVLAILSILAAIAMVSHRHFAEHAKSVEAEVALAEIDRLETLYHANHGTYSGDFSAIGFSLSSMLKYYKVTVQLQNGELRSKPRPSRFPVRRRNLPWSYPIPRMEQLYRRRI